MLLGITIFKATLRRDSFQLDTTDPKMSFTLVCTVLGLLILQYGLKIVYRLWLSPLARFPGPRIAGMTSLYEFYFDYFRQATYCFEIERMHKTYGRQILRPL